MAGLLDDWRKSQYLQMAEEKLQGLLNIPTEAQRFITNPQAFMGLLGRNELPRETGFAAGATGLPPKNVEPGGVLNPKAEPYTKGYEQGEPFSYAAMALPMAAPVGKAIAPKAYDMLENYMVKTGGMIPLEAYHGTPHNILGKFDINKVGTGEGAQAYGHGMYFAENPNVAKQYIVNAELQKTPEGMARSYAQQYPSEKEALEGAKQRLQRLLDNGDIAEAKVQEQVVNALESGSLGGNLYKVDIPDEYIPNMLDWDKPLASQNKQVLDALKKLDDPYINKAITTQPKLSKDGEYWEYMGNTYGSKSEALEDATPHRIITGYTGLGKNPAEVSNALNSVGIKGVSYLDQGSRLENQGTRNFVVFDPSTVKILEKNKKKVGLLD